MKIHLSKELENSIKALVKGGQYTSVDEAMNEAARLLLQKQPPAKKIVTEADLHKHMLEIGLLSQLPTPRPITTIPTTSPLPSKANPCPRPSCASAAECGPDGQ